MSFISQLFHFTAKECPVQIFVTVVVCGRGSYTTQKMSSYSAEQTSDQPDGQLSLMRHCSYNQAEVCDYD